MKLIVGLGNPGPRYNKTRHNIGFEILSAFADRHFFPSAKSRFDGLATDHSISGEKVVLLTPQTYMNASGKSIRQCVDFYKIEHDDVMVVVDDMNLDVGRMRIRASGSAGGQKGLADTIRHLGTDKISRLRVGVGRPPGRMAASDYVLQRFSDADRQLVDVCVQEAADGLEHWLKDGIEKAMNLLNTSKEPKPKK
jgi:PTH1 family peptidyl-tRNA hydrolase